MRIKSEDKPRSYSVAGQASSSFVIVFQKVVLCAQAKVSRRVHHEVILKPAVDIKAPDGERFHYFGVIFIRVPNVKSICSEASYNFYEMIFS